MADNQKIIFVNELQNMCKHCHSYNVFFHPPYNKNFIHTKPLIDSNSNLFIATLDANLKVVIRKHDLNNNANIVLNNFKTTISNISKPVNIKNIINIQKISTKKYHNQPIFIANAMANYHFQECFRGIVRLKEHLLSQNSTSHYNILIKDSITNFAITPISKIEGVDEVWELPKNVDRNSIQNKIDVSSAISELMNRYNSTSICVSKTAGPTKFGTDLIKNLIEPAKDYRHNLPIDTNHSYIAVTIRKDRKHRAGLDSTIEIKYICDTIITNGFTPVILACNSEEIAISEKIQKDITIIKNPSIEDQAIFYRDYCHGMIGTNGSCCNIPSLYNVPMFILAKGRFFPDDFYCFGLMISPYVETSRPFHGEFWKADNVVEYKIDADKKTSIEQYKKEFNDWLDGIGKDK